MCAPCHVLTLSRHSSDTGDRVTVTGTRYADAERPKWAGTQSVYTCGRSGDPLKHLYDRCALVDPTPHDCRTLHTHATPATRTARNGPRTTRRRNAAGSGVPTRERIRPIIRSNFPAKLPVYKLSSTPRGRAHSTQVTFDTRILVLMSCGPASSRVSRPCRASSRRRLPLRPPPGPHGARTMRLDADWMLIQLIVGCEACETGETANGMLTGCEGSEAFSTPVTQ